MRLVGQQDDESGCIISETEQCERKCNQSGIELVLPAAEA
jgi:hypothetical protein